MTRHKDKPKRARTGKTNAKASAVKCEVKPKRQRLPKLDSEEQTEKIVQELIAGISQTDIAERYKVTLGWINQIIAKHETRIQEGRQVRYAKRREKIDQFLEDELDSMMQICRLASINLVEALKKHQEALDKGEPMKLKEERIQVDGKTQRFIPSGDVEEALKIYQQTHSVLIQSQKNV